MKQFVIYTRVSTRRQGDSGLGLDAQHRDIQLYLSTYAEVPFEVLGEFQDIESGANSDRPELAKAIELAEKTSATLLVAKLDRLSRKVSFISTLMDRKKLNLTVASMPHADKFQLHIYAALAEQEREFISLRTKAALAPLKGTGKLGGNRGNIDKANEAARAMADTHAQKVIDTVLPLKEAGRTLQQIADTLNKTGVTTARGGKWYPTTVKNVLSRM
ncbi:recombinase family protein [Yoonia sp.]|jgi:DNA invertase Pin-like site-specific DNA recombinase|uniref:recombinase family protein n=1 Tax=Yoonia sp. TaxID=2212373 RepID=UPI003F6ED04D